MTAFIVVRPPLLPEDEGHTRFIGSFPTREAAQAWIDAQEGKYFGPRDYEVRGPSGPEPLIPALVAAVEAERRRRGLSDLALRTELGLGKMTLAEIDQRDPRLSTVQRLANFARRIIRLEPAP